MPRLRRLPLAELRVWTLNLSVIPSGCHLPYRGEALAVDFSLICLPKALLQGELASGSSTERLYKKML